VNAWIAIFVGVLIGWIWRRFAAKQAFGGVTDILLGITCVFMARWLLDVLAQLGLATRRFEIMLILCGAAILSWFFHALGHTRQIRKLHRTDRWGRPIPPGAMLDSKTDAEVHSPQPHSV
jgi:uncharacterized membrane protein YeaQ/YmgE (transglycosylase-associated protein family)